MPKRFKDLHSISETSTLMLSFRVAESISDAIFDDCVERKETLSEWLRAAADDRLASKAKKR
jgi:hypothetical protein